MSFSRLRPFILIIFFLACLFLLRNPLKNFDTNLSLFKLQYIDPFLKSIKNEDNSSSENVNSNRSSSSRTNTASTTVIGTKTNAPGKIQIPDYSNSNITLGPVIAPIKNNISADSSKLTVSGVLNQTNKERVKQGLKALSLNTSLNKSATAKLNDMFTNQYFEHVSPSGVSVSDLVRDEGYEYIVVGENLALGNFGGDIQVVTAWMNSPGHRANILDARFMDIGIAVGRGKYNGKEQWIAVQHFAKPLSSCPSPSSELKKNIDDYTLNLASDENHLSQLLKDIETIAPDNDQYRIKIEEYNNLVVLYNKKVKELKEEIEIYNAAVRKFNLCAGLK